MRSKRPLYLRLSTTSACGFRCPYCQPGASYRVVGGSPLAPERYARAVGVLAELGVRRVRLTGGEPLLRRDCPQTIAALAALPGIAEVALTTNGELLAQRAETLAAVGLRRVNVHLDTLRPERFARLTGRDSLAAVFAGIDAARRAGLEPLKINIVLMRGINDDEIVEFCQWAIAESLRIRFIELMDTGPARSFVREHFFSAADALARIAERFDLAPRFDERGCSPAREYLVAGGALTVGVIAAESAPFCEGCNRLRLTAEGELLSCLFSRKGFALDQALEVGIEQEQVLARLGAFLGQKVACNPALGMGATGPFSMAKIGG